MPKSRKEISDYCTGLNTNHHIQDPFPNVYTESGITGLAIIQVAFEELEIRYHNTGIHHNNSKPSTATLSFRP